MPPKGSSTLPERRERSDSNKDQPKITGFFKPKSAASTICKYFTGAPGSCKDGSNCRYKHSSELSQAANTLAAASQQQSTNNNNSNGNSAPQQQRQQQQAQQQRTRQSNEAMAPLPWDNNNTFKCKFTKEHRKVWTVVEDIFNDDDNKVTSLKSFASLMANVTSISLSKPREIASFPSLIKAIRQMPEDDFLEKFTNRILPKMIKYTLLGPRAFPTGLPLLTRNCTTDQGKLVLTQLQVSILLCVGFFGLYPYQHYSQKRAPGCNFTPLYNSASSTSIEKIKCLLAYFDTVTDPSVAPGRERGTPCYFDIEYIRIAIQHEKEITDNLMLSKKGLAQLSINDDGVIETQAGELQADFANKVIGGGVLHHGCVQEEIRFMISPELLVSRVFVEDLLDNEAVVMSGSLRYSEYVGYGGGFKFAGRIFPLPQPSPVEIQKQMFDISVVAFDAVDFSHSQSIAPSHQYRSDWVMRELIKAIAAFLPVAQSSAASAKSRESWIATGNWGCGVFAGDLELKLILQLLAASFVGRPVHYFTFGNEKFMTSSQIIYKMLTDEKVTVAHLMSIVLEFSDLHQKAQDERQRRIEEDEDLSDLMEDHAQDDSQTSVETAEYESEILDADGNLIELQPKTAVNNKKKEDKNSILHPPKSLYQYIVAQLKK